MRIIRRTWRYLDREPGPLSSLIIFLAASLALGALLNAMSTLP